jgi:RNA polymerase sigma-70 factor (ECF subfamily)
VSKQSAEVSGAPIGSLGETNEIDVSDIECLYRRFAPYVGALAFRLLGHDAEVDDLVQDVFVAAAGGIATLRDASTIQNWLARVTVRKAVRKLRKRRFMRALSLADQVDYRVLAAPDSSANQKALLAMVYTALDKLPAATRVVWILRRVMREPLPAIVTLSACSQSSVERRLRDAESHMARELRRG